MNWLWGFVLWIFGVSTSEDYVANINYRVYDSNSANSIYTWKYGSEDFSKLTCATNGPLSYVFTGFGENDQNIWMNDLISNLRTYRKGCIVVVDYWKYTKVDLSKFAEVFLHYEGIVTSIVNEVVAFNKRGFTAANTYFFGFSFGGQVAMGVGRKVSSKIGGKVNKVHVCDPTALGFPVTDASKDAGVNVQCIHTNSVFWGTKKRDCHQDWNMGNCGLIQSSNENVTSHMQCPLFYNSAFNNNFLAIPKPDACVTPTTLGSYQSGFKMGYNEARTPTGEFYAKTGILPPYTG